MKFRGTKAALAALVSRTLMLGACTSGEDPGAENSSPGTVEIVVGGGDPCIRDVGIKETSDGQVVYSPGPGNWSGYNNVTNATYSTYNLVVADQMLGNLWHFGADDTVCEDEEFGTSEVVSQDPLKMKYTIVDNAKRSDGTPITINNCLLDWAAQNPEPLAPGLASGQNEDAGAVFNHVSTTFPEYAPEGPQDKTGSKTLAVKFKGQCPDYKAALSGPLPAHIVAKQFGLELDVPATAILDCDVEAVKKVAKFWSKGWIFQPGQPPDAPLIPPSNRYQLKQDGWKDTTLTFEANPNYWDTPAGTKNLVFSHVADNQMSQSLQNDDLDVIRPQTTVDTVKRLQEIGSSIQVVTTSGMAWEHLDFNFRDSNIFSDAQGGKKLREASARCVPRRIIFDWLVKPIKEDAQLLNACEVLPFQKNYQEATSKSYDGSHDQVDIKKAKQLVAEGGIQTPIRVRIDYKMGNQRRTETIAAIQFSCKDIGFEAVGAAAQDFFENAVVKGDYEAALYVQAGSGLTTTGQNIQATGRPQNYGKYSNPKIDEAWNKLTNTPDAKEQVEQTMAIERELWDTLFNIPLYSHPGVVAWNSKVRNARVTAAQSTVSWSAFQWQMR